MKKLIVPLMVILTSTLFSAAQTKLPPLPRLAQINDSIVSEAHMLYFSDKINWETTDFLFEKYEVKDIGGSATYFKDSIWVCLFCDKNQENTLVEIRWDLKGGQLTENKSNTPRPITEEEKDVINRRKNLIAKVIETYGDSIKSLPSEYGNLNIDLIPVGNNITRMYIIQGILVKDIMPFGNDYSIDIDDQDNLLCFRKHHSSFIPAQMHLEDGEEVKTTVHSHLPDNPYITVTDICNFLLYGRDIYGQTSFVVLSSAFNCVFAYMDELKSIVTSTKEDIGKLLK